FSIQTDHFFRADLGAAATINNAGTISKTAGSGTTDFTGAFLFTNSGVLEAQTGILDFTLNSSGSASSAGEIRALSGAEVRVDQGTLTLQSGASLTGAGQTRILNSGTIAIDTGANVAATNVELDSSGTLTGAGILTVNGALLWTGGTMSGGGSTVV